MERVVDPGPFAGAELEELELPGSPLTRVIAQIRFPVSLSLGSREKAMEILQPIQATYPEVREERQASLVVLDDRLVPGEGTATVWRMRDAASGWTVSISQTFAALETTTYTHRSDLVGRLTALSESLIPINTSGRLDRFGLRYINQMLPSGARDLTSMFRTEIRGPLSIPLEEEAELQLGLCQAFFKQRDLQLRAHWGLIPPGTVPDPSVPPLPQTSGLLDIDVFTGESSEYSVANVVGAADRCSRLAYAFFRWSIREETLQGWEAKQ